MTWLLYLLLAIVVVVVWLLFGSRRHCPSCGLPFSDSLLNRIDEVLGDSPSQCNRCGWRRD